MEKIGDFIKGTGEEIVIGDFIIRKLKDGSLWLEFETGEGMQVQEDKFEDAIRQFFAENF